MQGDWLSQSTLSLGPFPLCSASLSFYHSISKPHTFLLSLSFLSFFLPISLSLSFFLPISLSPPSLLTYLPIILSISIFPYLSPSLSISDTHPLSSHSPYFLPLSSPPILLSITLPPILPLCFPLSPSLLPLECLVTQCLSHTTTCACF